MVEGLSLPRFTIEPLEARIAPATFTVTTAADSGPGSLRQAILDANATTDPDEIVFSGVETAIQVLSPLPAVTSELEITGGALDGTNAGPGAAGLTVDARVTFHGISISNFAGYGVLVNPSGYLTMFYTTVAKSGLDGVHVNPSGHVGMVESTVSENGLDGVHVNGGSASAGMHNTITKNGRNGVTFQNATGGYIAHSSLSDNAGHGLFIEGSSKVNMGTEPAPGTGSNGDTTNVKTKIWNNGLAGIYVLNSTEITIGGANVTGNAANVLKPEDRAGVVLVDSNQISIGAEKADFLQYSFTIARFARGNSIYDNFGHGISIQGGSQVRLFANSISGNTGDGVRIDGATDVEFSIKQFNQTTGGATRDELIGNSITGNAGVGIRTIGSASAIDIRGQVIRANGSGAIIVDGASDVTIGGVNVYLGRPPFSDETYETSRDANVIDAGTTSGIVVLNGSKVAVVSNQHLGAGLPIDLGGDGFTPNDPGDVDNGANHLQNYPLLEFTGSGSTSTTKAALSTDAGATEFRIQIYSYDSTTSTYTVVSTQNVTTDANGNAALTFTGLNGPSLFATATNLTNGETSEMSPVAKTLPRLSIGNLTITEGNSGLTNATLTVTLDKVSDAPISVSFGTVNGAAVFDSDYSFIAGTLVFAPGETSKTITIPVIGDAVQEATESFYVDLSNAQGAHIGSGRGEVKIVNDDGLPTISIEDAVVVEGSNLSSTRPGYTEYQYRVILSGPSLDPVTVRLSSSGGTATAGDDYDAVDEVVTFAPGVTSVTKTVYVKNDTAAELNETIGFRLSEPSAGVLGAATGTLTIADEDGWMLVMDPVEVLEGSGGKMKETAVQVRLVNTLGLTDHLAPIHVSFLAQEGSAIRGIDFIAPDGVLTFAPGELEKTIMVQIAGDREQEENESFGIQFGNAIGTKVPEARGLVTILDDDIASLLISKGGKQATWLDADGDKVKLTVSKPVLTFESFVFGQTTGGGIVLEKLILPAEDGSPLSLKLKVAKTASGDGRIDLKTIDATGRDLGAVMVDGNLGSILSGDSDLKTPGARALSVGSFGAHPGGVNVEPLESAVLGGVGSFKVKSDFTGVRLEVQGAKVGTLSVGGNVTDSVITVGGTSEAAAQIGRVKVRGDCMASSLAVGASAGPDGMFGTEDDVLSGGLLSKIARITIGGTISGTHEAEDTTDHFGFVAAKIAAFQVGKTRVTLSGSETDVMALGETGDVTLRELGEFTPSATSMTRVFAESDRSAAVAWLDALGR